MRAAVAFLVLVAALVGLLYVSMAGADDGTGGQTALMQKLVSGPTPTLCSSEFPSSTQAAATRWRTTAGTGDHQRCML